MKRLRIGETTAFGIILSFVWACFFSPASAAQDLCVGDCNDTGVVGINELVTVVNVALDVLPPSVCAAGDADGDEKITIGEAILAVDNALTGCPPVLLVVTKIEDTADGVCDEDCSLREAVIMGNTGPREVSVTVPAGTYVLTLVGAGEDAAATGDLDITEDLTLIGAGAEETVIDGNAEDRVFHLHGGTTRVSGITIRNGRAFGPLGFSIGQGGGVFVEPDVVLDMRNSALRNNSASVSTLFGGGGIFSSARSMTLTNTLISDNSGGQGGGIVNSGPATAELTNCTISSNTGAIRNNGNLLVANSTVQENGSGIFNSEFANLTLMKSMIIANQEHGLWNEGSAAATESIISGNAGRGVENGRLATLVLVDSTVANNSDGGIKNGESGTLILENCTVSGNSSEFGGGIYNPEGATALLRNTTLSDNMADQGGGIFNFFGNVELTNCTLSDNSADYLGGGILSIGTTNLTASIVANSRSGRNCDGTIVSGGHNLDDDGSCGLVAEGDLSNVEARLAPLGSYGGPTDTHALCTEPGVPDASCMAASPALDAGDDDACPDTDQRGVERPQPPGAVCDIGAYEAE